MSPVISAKDGQTSDIVASQWLKGYDKMDQSDVLHALTTISTLASHTSADNRRKLTTNLLALLRSYSGPIEYIKYLAVATSQVIQCALSLGLDFVVCVITAIEYANN